MGSLEEKKAELEKLEKDLFFLEMKDHWSSDDCDRSRHLNNRIRNLRTQISAMTEDDLK